MAIQLGVPARDRLPWRSSGLSAPRSGTGYDGASHATVSRDVLTLPMPW